MFVKVVRSLLELELLGIDERYRKIEGLQYNMPVIKSQPLARRKTEMICSFEIGWKSRLTPTGRKAALGSGTCPVEFRWPVLVYYNFKFG